MVTFRRARLRYASVGDLAQRMGLPQAGIRQVVGATSLPEHWCEGRREWILCERIDCPNCWARHFKRQLRRRAP